MPHGAQKACIMGLTIMVTSKAVGMGRAGMTVTKSIWKKIRDKRANAGNWKLCDTVKSAVIVLDIRIQGLEFGDHYTCHQGE